MRHVEEQCKRSNSGTKNKTKTFDSIPAKNAIDGGHKEAVGREDTPKGHRRVYVTSPITAFGYVSE